mgnify:CR=1 FL=1
MPSLLMLGPDLNAVSGISTHLNQLIGSSVGQRFRWRHFQVGSEGRRESPAQKLVRMVVSPLQFAARRWTMKPIATTATIEIASHLVASRSS